MIPLVSIAFAKLQAIIWLCLWLAVLFVAAYAVTSPITLTVMLLRIWLKGAC